MQTIPAIARETAKSAVQFLLDESLSIVAGDSATRPKGTRKGTIRSIARTQITMAPNPPVDPKLGASISVIRRATMSCAAV